MAQLEHVLKRIVHTMATHLDANMPFQFAKLDLKDRFQRMAVSNEDAWNFCYVLPTLKQDIDLDDVELVVPNSLQMGWYKSPPFFCSGSETARNLIERMFLEPMPPHKFEHIMVPAANRKATMPPTPSQTPITKI